MSILSNRVRAFGIGALFALMVTGPAFADDSEIYSAATPTGAEPNVLFIIDTSGSMDTEVEQTIASYQPLTTYVGSCDDNYVYISSSSKPPTCSTDSDVNRIPKSAFVCQAAAAALKSGGAGFYGAVNAAQYRKGSGGKYTWRKDTFNTTDYIECKDDDGKDGLATGDGKPYILDNATTATGGWGTKQGGLWGALTNSYYFFSANYVNWRYSAGSSKVTRLQIVRDVGLSLASTLNNVKLGLMRYSGDADGGYVVTPIGAIKDTRTKIIDDLKSFDPYDGNNGTPLSETYYEAALYLTGGAVHFGLDSKPGKSTDTTAVTADGVNYISPIEYSCQKNYIVYLTDGAPTVDQDANTLIPPMIGLGATGKCAADPFPPDHDTGYIDGDGSCMDDLAKWLSSPDTDLNKDVTDKQQALTYMIGFGSGLSTKSRDYLNMIAAAGGTDAAYSAADVPSLTETLQTIFKKIQEDSGTFVTPSITVNAFNRSQTDQDLYFSLFKAANTTHWPGNLKKYRLGYDKKAKKDIIVDSKGVNAVTDDGKFTSEAISFWSNPKDGDDITKGGAAGAQVAPADRVLYTSLAGNTLKGVSGNLIDWSKNTTTLNDKVVGTGTDDKTCSATCQRAVNWLRGVDVNNEDKDASTTQYKFMGDPLHATPAVVTYGLLSDKKTSDNVIYLPTNDGLLHAINAADGKELWAYMPPELLGRLGKLSSKTTVTSRDYGLDGDVRVLRMDVNQNGRVDSGDRVWLFFGMRAGGNHYYGLDVTNRNEPKVLWNIGPEKLPNVGQTWSPPVVARVNVNAGKDNEDKEKFVLIFGGGYDTHQESQTYSTDDKGNRIYMVDASSGKLLWFAGATATAGDTTPPDLALDADGQKMNNSIPARVTVIDTNGDLFADRMYVGDMGGRVWRFDINNGKSKTDLVTGGVIATLGNGGAASPTDENNRRFYNAVDVALVDVRGRSPYYNLAVGSGYRGHPLNTVTQERFYSLHDDLPYVRMTKDQYSKYTPITAADLTDVTPATTAKAPTTPRGWSLDMYASKSWVGEKVLSESVTVNNTTLFTSFQPGQIGGKKGACYPSTTNRAYSINTLTGAINFVQELNQEGIVGGVNVAVKRGGDDDGTGDGGDGGGGGDGDPPPPPPPGSPPTICLAGMHVLNKCVDVGGTVRTWWNRSDAQ